jgi:hypothetical protein
VSPGEPRRRLGPHLAPADTRIREFVAQAVNDELAAGDELNGDDY